MGKKDGNWRIKRGKIGPKTLTFINKNHINGYKYG